MNKLHYGCWIPLAIFLAVPWGALLHADPAQACEIEVEDPDDPWDQDDDEAEGDGEDCELVEADDDDEDATARTARKMASDVVRTCQGDVLRGTVKSIEADGNLRLAGGQYKGDVVVSVASLSRIAFNGGSEEKGTDELIMTNGDRLLGTVRAITDGEVVMESEAVGSVKVPRKVAAFLSIGRGKTMLAGDFTSSGSIEPWKAVGKWAFSAGGLASARGSDCSLAAKLEQKEAVTFIANVAGDADEGPECTLALHVRDASSYGSGSIYATVGDGMYQICTATDDDGTTSVANGPLETQDDQWTLRFAYDPAARKTALWLNGTQLCEAAASAKLPNGQYVMLVPIGRCTVTSVRVMRGIVSPSEAGRIGQDELDVIDLSNRDRISASAITMADGAFSVKTPFGELKLQADSVSSIVFRKMGREEPVQSKNTVRVSAGGSTLTLQLRELTADHLTGASQCCGSVKLRRAKLTAIWFGGSQTPTRISRKKPADDFDF